MKASRQFMSGLFAGACVEGRTRMLNGAAGAVADRLFCTCLYDT
jgi:hypothetical protein